MKTITAQLNARTIKFGGRNIQAPACEVTFTQDEKGTWRNKYNEVVFERDVIADLKAAKNWKEIRAEHFPMVGF